MSGHSFMMEQLEGRTLLTATPSPVIQADQAAVAYASQTLATLQANRITTLKQDQLALTNAWKQNPAAVAVRQQQYQATLQQRQVQVAAARADLLQARAQWAQVYRDDMAAILAARGNPAAVATARAQLAADRIENRRLIMDAQSNIRSTQVSWNRAVATDLRAVQRTRLLGGSQVQNARNTYLSHVAQFRNAIIEARQSLLFAQRQLAQDIRLGL